jgi:pumilio family protein 6
VRVPLEQLCVAQASALLTSRVGSQVLVEVVACWRSNDVIRAVVEACSTETSTMYDDAVAHVALKKLCQAGGTSYADSLLHSAIAAGIDQWAASNRGAFVLSALLDAAGAAAKAEAIEALLQHKDAIADLATTQKGAQVLIVHLR